MVATLDITLSNFPDYLLREAEVLVAKLGELAPWSDAVSIKLGRNELFYYADIRLESPGKHISSNSKSRYLENALEDSFTKIMNLLCPLETGGVGGSLVEEFI